MKVAFCSAFRSATHYLDRYFEQVAGLRALLETRGDTLRLILGEGDHVDDTRALLPLMSCGYDAEIVSYDHGGPDHGSVVNPVRFANMAKIWNRIWQRVPQDADAVVFCEADLVWQPETMLDLIDNLAHAPAVAPFIRLQRRGWPSDAFYDNWAFRRNGIHIGLRPPYFEGWDVQQPIQVDSGGSCVAMRGALARRVSWPAEDVIVGLCRQLYEQGGSLWLLPQLEVVHL